MQEFRHPTGTVSSMVSTADDPNELHEQMEKNRLAMEEQGFRETRRKKLGRNDPCPCGSGVKFKKCHINRVAELNQLLEKGHA
mgnify:CR=1 FL=1